MTMASVALRQKSVRRSRDTITPMDLRVNWHGDAPPSLKQGEYRPYGTGKKQDGWMCVHARQCPGKQPERDWPEFKWAQFLGEFDMEHVIVVGSKKGSMSFSGCEDLRGQPMLEVCDAISRCKFIVGPSSGPLALAMLCCTPVVWWSSNLKDQPRFQKAWNPFSVETIQVATHWEPDADEVEAACQRFL
jgi:ADP-heptose:LPS heptosyltransferase